MVQTLTSRKTTPEAETKAALRVMAQTDLYSLARRVLYKDAKTPMSPDFHKPVVQFRQTSPFSRNLYLLGRDHLKTSLITVAGNVQRILCDAQVRILLAGNIASSAEAQLSEIKGHLVNPLLTWLFPEILWDDPERQATEAWSGSKIAVKRKNRTKEATIETVGAEGAITGRHYEHGSYDDLVDEQNSQTRDQMEKVIYWFKTTQSLFEPGATQDIVGTPWAFNDLYDWLVKAKLKREFQLGVYRQPCWKIREPGVLRIDKRGGIADDEYLLDASGKKIPAYPEKHTREALDGRERVDPRIFAAQWLLRPTDDASALFPRNTAIIRSRDLIPNPAKLWCVMAVDPASSIKSWADNTAIVVVGFDELGFCYLLDVRAGQWTESQVVDQVYEAYHRTPGIRIIGFETVGFQKLYMREFSRAGETRGFLPIVKLERDNMIGKSMRIRSIEPWWSKQQMIIAADCISLEDFLEEAQRFRAWKKDQQDDMLDALADCLQLRVRPVEDDPEAGMEDEERERRVFERGHPMLDRASMREAYAQHRMTREHEQRQEQDALGAGVLSEFYSG